MKTKSYIFIFMLAALAGVAQNKTGLVALMNGVAHIGNGKVVEGSLIVIEKNKIKEVLDVRNIRINRTAYDTIIDISGKHVYPGLINCNNVLGLHDAEAVRATRDFAEVGAVNPHIRALIAYNTDNLIVPTIKTNGVLYTQATPRGGLISGQSSLMALEGWNWEDAVMKADDGVHVNFPRLQTLRFSEEEGAIRAANKKYDEELAVLEKFFADARAYCATEKPSEKNLRMESMRKVFEGRANLYLHADKVKDMLSAIGFAKKFSIQKPVIVGGKESYRITAELKKNKIPVMLNRILDLPDNADDDVDIVYRAPYLLQKDSVLFCIQLEGDMEAMQSRNLAFNAGAAVTYGLSREEALASVSYNAARIIGVDSEVGTLEAGKLASFVVSTGDLLDMRTNNIIMAFIGGKPVTLFNKQTELYLRYKNKYGIK